MCFLHSTPRPVREFTVEFVDQLLRDVSCIPPTPIPIIEAPVLCAIKVYFGQGRLSNQAAA